MCISYLWPLDNLMDVFCYFLHFLNKLIKKIIVSRTSYYIIVNTLVWPFQMNKVRIAPLHDFCWPCYLRFDVCAGLVCGVSASSPDTPHCFLLFSPGRTTKCMCATIPSFSVLQGMLTFTQYGYILFQWFSGSDSSELVLQYSGREWPEQGEHAKRCKAKRTCQKTTERHLTFTLNPLSKSDRLS